MVPTGTSKLPRVERVPDNGAESESVDHRGWSNDVRVSAKTLTKRDGNSGASCAAFQLPARGRAGGRGSYFNIWANSRNKKRCGAQGVQVNPLNGGLRALGVKIQLKKKRQKRPTAEPQPMV